MGRPETLSKGKNTKASIAQPSKTGRIVMSEVSPGEKSGSAPRISNLRVCEIASNTISVSLHGTGVVSLLSESYYAMTL